jgi:hypothetical protein
MSKVLKGVSGEFKQPEPGSYPVAIVVTADIGTQPEDVIKAGVHAGKIVKGGPKLMFNLELLTGEDKPFTLIKEMTITFGERSALTEFAKAFLGLSAKEFAKLSDTKGVSLSEFLGKKALASVERTESGKTKLKGVMPLPRGMVVPEPKSELLDFDIDDVSDDVFSKLPKLVQDKILQSAERKESSSSDSFDGDSSALDL